MVAGGAAGVGSGVIESIVRVGGGVSPAGGTVVVHRRAYGDGDEDGDGALDSCDKRLGILCGA